MAAAVVGFQCQHVHLASPWCFAGGQDTIAVGYGGCITTRSGSKEDSMRKVLPLILATVALCNLGSSCPIALQQTSVQFVNNSTLGVDVQFFYGEEQGQC